MRQTLCKRCGSEFVTSNNRQVYCSRKCRRETTLESYRVNRPSIKPDFMNDSIPTATIGAIHELVTCVDLMRRGFHVFRAQSPSCPCDLICVTSKGMLRIEVRTGHRLNDGKLVWPIRLNPDAFDVLAVVLYTSEIVYLDNEFRPIDVGAL